jgi:flagellar hook-associated protein 1 FlgK
MTSVASHNIANANNEFYTRQRAQASSNVGNSFGTRGGVVGEGSHVSKIERVFDEYKFLRYKESSRDLAYSDYRQTKLVETSNLFPEINKTGLYKSLQDYFSQWSELSANPTSQAQKADLLSKATRLSDDTRRLRNNIVNVQKKIDAEIPTLVAEINNTVDQIAEINKKIVVQESVRGNIANDLRDQRDKLEITLSSLVPIDVFNKGIMSNNSTIPGSSDSSSSIQSGYTLALNGLVLIDSGKTNHLISSNGENAQGYNTIYFEYQDGDHVDIEHKIIGGKIGAMLDLRGRKYDNDTDRFQDGTLQRYIDDVDSFATGLINSTNSKYALNPSSYMASNDLISLNERMIVTGLGRNIKLGSFDISVYDSTGKQVATRSIEIHPSTTVEDIVNQINKNVDDNNNSASGDDVDDRFEARLDNGQLTIARKDANSDFTIAIDDRGTNFAGVIGLHRFFDGESARDITVNQELSQNSSDISASGTSAEGDNQVALAMNQLQYDDVEFLRLNTNEYTSDTISGFFTQVATLVSSDTYIAVEDLDTKSALNKTIKDAFDSVTKVSLDEELTNLMLFQTSYQANAKVITTIDQMLNTLLGIKQP